MPTGLRPWKCTPIPASRYFPRRGKFALCLPLDLISITKHSAARSAPSGGKVVCQHQKGCIYSSASEVVWYFHRPSGRLPGFIIRGRRLFQKAPYLLCSRNLQIEGNSPLSFSKNQPPSAATPYPASPDFPLFRGQNNPLYDSLIPIGLRQQKSSPEGLLFALEKFLILPILLHGRAQAFCFNESARGSRRGGMSVSSKKNRYSHGCHQDF